MTRITRLGIAFAMLAGFALAPASAALARDRDSRHSESHARSSESHHERSTPPRELRGPPPSSHNMPSRNFGRSSGVDRAPREFSRSREFSHSRSEARDFGSRDRGFESRSFTREARARDSDNRRAPRDFSRSRPSRDFERPSRDFERPSRDFHGAPRDFRGSRSGPHDSSQSGASHQFNGFHGHDFDHFTSSERESWRHGNWHHGHHHGHFGWWFIVDNFWFFYDAPIYPYPLYVSYYYDDAYYGDRDYYWYWCDDPRGYYPYVQECYGPWIPVSPSEGYGPDQNDGYYGDDGY